MNTGYASYTLPAWAPFPTTAPWWDGNDEIIYTTHASEDNNHNSVPPSPSPNLFGTPLPAGTPVGLLAPWNDPVNQDILSNSVAITRDFRGGIFNALVELDQWNEYEAPTGTRWALLPEGKTFEEARCEMRFCSWLDCFVKYDIQSMLNKPGVVHVLKEDVYYNIMFTNWTRALDDSYYYRRLQKQSKKDDTRETRMANRQLQGQAYEQGAEREQPEREWIYYCPDSDDSDCGQTQQPEREWIYDCPDGDESNCDDNNESNLGGGFQYIRDEFPITVGSLVKCPVCDTAKAEPSELTGPVDERFVRVKIKGATPDHSKYKILAIGQDSNPKCNRGIFQGTDKVRPNAKGIGNQTALLRRTLPKGLLTAMRYTIFFSATNEAGSCQGQVSVCSPPEGVSCEDWFYGYDATSSSYCDSY